MKKPTFNWNNQFASDDYWENSSKLKLNFNWACLLQLTFEIAEFQSVANVEYRHFLRRFHLGKPIFFVHLSIRRTVSKYDSVYLPTGVNLLQTPKYKCKNITSTYHACYYTTYQNQLQRDSNPKPLSSWAKTQLLSSHWQVWLNGCVCLRARLWVRIALQPLKISYIVLVLRKVTLRWFQSDDSLNTGR